MQKHLTFFACFLFLFLFFLLSRSPTYAVCQDWENSCGDCTCTGTGCNQTCEGYDYSTMNICTTSQSCNLNPQQVVNSCDCSGSRSDADGTIWTFNQVSCTNGSSCIGDIGRGGLSCHYCATLQCNDNGAMDNGETGVDCGGGGCGSCPVVVEGCGLAPCGMCEQKMSDGTCQPANNVCCHRKCFGDGCWTTGGAGGDECTPEGPQACTVPPAPNCTIGMNCNSSGSCGGGWCKGCCDTSQPDWQTTCPQTCPLGGKCETCAPDPPPQPPPPPGIPWIKLKDTSVHDYGTLYSPIHRTPAAYDSDDTDVSRKFVIGAAGVVSAKGLIRIDGHKTGAEVSTPKWKRESYTTKTKNTVNDYIEYVKARKKYTEITVLDNTLQNNTIYIWKGPENLIIRQADINNFNNKNIVFVTEGSITFDIASKKIDTNSSVAFIAKVINFFHDSTYIEEANGIFSANLIHTGPANGTAATGLKINGNLAGGSVIMKRRQNDDNRKPALFMAFDPVPFMELLPLLSTSGYDWRQLQ